MKVDPKFNILTTVAVSDSMRDKWEPLLNILADIMAVSAALIMQVHEREIEVFTKSTGEGNVYERGEKANLDTGLYCEEVMARQAELLVPNALEDPHWSKNPDIPLGMISYLGMPVLWPSGHVFGTICVLDVKPNAYSTLFRKLLQQFRFAVEKDLIVIYKQHELVREIAERQAAESALRKSEELRGDLVQMIVHDLRSPVASLLLSLQLVRRDLLKQLGGQQRGDLDNAIENTRRLERMINSLLDVYRLESGQMPLAMERCDLCRPIEEAFTSLSGLTAGRDVAFIRADAAMNAVCDPKAVRRIVENLISNALRLTPQSGRVKVTVERNNGQARVSVSDTGPGIPELHRTVIFEKYGQLETAKEGFKHTSGLGLSFCKLAVEAQGGTIGLESTLGEGSTFWFTLPMDAES